MYNISHLPANNQDHTDWAKIMTKATFSGKHDEYSDKKDLNKEYNVCSRFGDRDKWSYKKYEHSMLKGSIDYPKKLGFYEKTVLSQKSMHYRLEFAHIEFESHCQIFSIIIDYLGKIF